MSVNKSILLLKKFHLLNLNSYLVLAIFLFLNLLQELKDQLLMVLIICFLWHLSCVYQCRNMSYLYFPKAIMLLLTVLKVCLDSQFAFNFFEKNHLNDTATKQLKSLKKNYIFLPKYQLKLNHLTLSKVQSTLLKDWTNWTSKITRNILFACANCRWKWENWRNNQRTIRNKNFKIYIWLHRECSVSEIGFRDIQTGSMGLFWWWLQCKR